jgi:hypothetical protein
MDHADPTPRQRVIDVDLDGGAERGERVEHGAVERVGRGAGASRRLSGDEHRGVHQERPDGSFPDEEGKGKP